MARSRPAAGTSAASRGPGRGRGKRWPTSPLAAAARSRPPGRPGSGRCRCCGRRACRCGTSAPRRPGPGSCDARSSSARAWASTAPLLPAASSRALKRGGHTTTLHAFQPRTPAAVHASSNRPAAAAISSAVAWPGRPPVPVYHASPRSSATTVSAQKPERKVPKGADASRHRAARTPCSRAAKPRVGAVDGLGVVHGEPAVVGVGGAADGGPQRLPQAGVGQGVVDPAGHRGHDERPEVRPVARLIDADDPDHDGPSDEAR